MEPMIVTAPQLLRVCMYRGMLVRCALCERYETIASSHADADRVLLSHLAECQGASEACEMGVDTPAGRSTSDESTVSGA